MRRGEPQLLKMLPDHEILVKIKRVFHGPFQVKPAIRMMSCGEQHKINVVQSIPGGGAGLVVLYNKSAFDIVTTAVALIGPGVSVPSLFAGSRSDRRHI